jgi:hypothetical protein
MKKENSSRRSFMKNIIAGAAMSACAVSGVKKVKANENAAGVKNLTDEVYYKKTTDFKKYYETLR